MIADIDGDRKRNTCGSIFVFQHVGQVVNTNPPVIARVPCQNQEAARGICPVRIVRSCTLLRVANHLAQILARNPLDGAGLVGLPPTSAVHDGCSKPMTLARDHAAVPNADMRCLAGLPTAPPAGWRRQHAVGGSSPSNLPNWPNGQFLSNGKRFGERAISLPFLACRIC